MPRCHLYQATQTNWMIMLIYILPPSAGPPGAPRSLEREIEHHVYTHNLQTAKCARQYITKTCHALKASWMLSRPAPFNFSPILGNFLFLSPGFFFFFFFLNKHFRNSAQSMTQVKSFPTIHIYIHDVTVYTFNSPRGVVVSQIASQYPVARQVFVFSLS